MNIVVVTCEFYPYMNPTSNCISPYVQELKKDNHIDIICPLDSVGFQPFHSDNIELHYITNFRNTLRALCNTKIREKKCLLFWRSIFFVLRCYSVFLSYFSFPTRHSWRKKEYEKQIFSLQNQKNIDCIISVSGWPCSHLAAMTFKKIYPQTRWVTFTLDPYTFNPVLYRNILFVRKRRERCFRSEKAIYCNADYNIFTEELYEMAIRDFAQPQHKTICFPYVLTNFDIPKQNRKGKGQLLLIYAGTLNRQIRNPEKMLSVMKNQDGLIINLYVSGDCNDILERHKSPNIHIFGFLPKEQYIHKILYEADILINLGNSNSLQSPSKFLELISTGLPIINFYVKEDANYRMTDLYPLGLNISPDDRNARRKIDVFCREVAGKRLSYGEIKELFPDNVLENQLKKLEEMIYN